MTELNKEQMYDHFYSEKPRKKISTPWRFIAMDIGLYLGECLIRKHKDRGLYWGFTKKKTFNHFKPAVMGLKLRMVDPDEGVETGVCKDIERATEYSIDSKARRLAYDKNWDENALLDSFRKIEEFVYLKHSPPNLVEVREMNEKEARKYFEWYVHQIPFHIKDLSMCDIIDFSTESLVHVWCRYLEQVDLVEKVEQKKIEKQKLKKLIATTEIDGIKVYEGCLVRALDISVYFAELFRRKHEAQGIHWGYITEPKSLPYVNRPILRGFKPETEDGPEVVMDQIGIFYDLAVRVAAGERDKNALMDLYREWDAKV